MKKYYFSVGYFESFEDEEEDLMSYDQVDFVCDNYEIARESLNAYIENKWGIIWPIYSTFVE